jgi:hypothetical protein
MIRGAVAALAALAALAPLEAQSRFRAGIGAGAGLMLSVGDTRSSYGAGPAGSAELSFGLSGSPWSARLEAWYLRLNGAHAPELGFPALNALAFDASVIRHLGPPGRAVAGYLVAGAGAWNLQDALPFATWQTRLGLHGGAGVELGHGKFRPFVEGRVVHITGGPPTDFVALRVGGRWGR